MVKKREAAAMICWSLWMDRKRRLLDRASLPSAVLLSNGAGFLSSWQRAQCVSGQVPAVIPPGFLKLNFDGALFQNANIGGFGCVIRDNRGSFVAACNGIFNCQMDAFLVEALSCREALSWIKSCGWTKVLIESKFAFICSSFNSDPHQ
ncbi:hypothetical protein OROHE_004974 [Orobanche hederae]